MTSVLLKRSCFTFNFYLFGGWYGKDEEIIQKVLQNTPTHKILLLSYFLMMYCVLFKFVLF